MSTTTTGWPATGLTTRESEVLAHLAGGLTNPDIANRLTVSRKTVSTHLEHIYAKLGVSTRTQAALLAVREGLLGEAPLHEAVEARRGAM